MELKHIAFNACPTCLSRVVSESQLMKHTNGQWFESRTFECGCCIEHIPNFNRSEVKTECPESDKMILRKKTG